MINQEKEYRKVFNNHKRWAKHWTTSSAHRAHSSTTSLIKPADKTYEFINKLNLESEKSFKEKVEILIEFYDEENILERSRKLMGSGYYFNALQAIKAQKGEIESEKRATIFKMPKN